MTHDLRPLMFTGTGSDVGKSIIATAFCRIFLQDGYHPAPFKAQNMALNSFATPEGLEIGRAQAVQAEAAGVACHTDMNPLLLKPQSDHTSQVILGGKVAGVSRAHELFGSGGGIDREHLRAECCAAFDRLSSRFNPIVIEGAGSMTELNLRDVDIVNLPMAAHAGAAVILVADIDRGGVFASVYGSIALLRPAERALVAGIIINKFRGDMSLFDSGRAIIEELCGVPVLGVVPFFTDITIEEEDSVDIAKKAMEASYGKVNIAVVLLRHLSNFTDFDALEQDPRVHLFYTDNPAAIEGADIVILPGSKSTIDDLIGLRHSGVADAVRRARRRGATIMGICGGYQMMGRTIRDPHRVEGDIETIPGLGLLPITTTMTAEKTTVQVSFRLAGSDEAGSMRGYEIHCGVSEVIGEAQPLTVSEDGAAGGCIVDEHCFGTYIHGILDNSAFVERLLAPYTVKCTECAFDYAAFKETQYDRLAAHIRKYVDINKVYNIMRR